MLLYSGCLCSLPWAKTHASGRQLQYLMHAVIALLRLQAGWMQTAASLETYEWTPKLASLPSSTQVCTLCHKFFQMLEIFVTFNQLTVSIKETKVLSTSTGIMRQSPPCSQRMHRQACCVIEHFYSTSQTCTVFMHIPLRSGCAHLRGMSAPETHSSSLARLIIWIK